MSSKIIETIALIAAIPIKNHLYPIFGAGNNSSIHWKNLKIHFFNKSKNHIQMIKFFTLRVELINKW